ncbi:MAG: DUF1800 domain-containing protein [Armatimonadetes bacterium]|nr:DUF1800 domain-containing protein [Armatimonadota bacterium]
MSGIRTWKPTRTEPWDRRRARHLLERAGFGGTSAEVDRLVKMGPKDAVAHLIAYPPPVAEPLPEFLQMDTAPPDPREAKDGAEREQRFREFVRMQRRATFELKGWWLKRMLTTERPFEEKLALFWHGHFTTESDKVKNPILLYNQNQLFRTHARGRLGDLLLEISRDPAMLIYLDNHLNVRGHPNENYARELFELFSLGIGHYTEQDVLETARAFTGWTIQRGRPARVGTAQFMFNERQHDDGEKTFLGRTGSLGGEDVVRIILDQPSTADFLCRKLWRYFVADEINPEDNEELASWATIFRANGYQLQPLLEILFSSVPFYDERNLARRIKSPVELVVGTLRRLQVEPADRLLQLLTGSLKAMGQDLFDPPNVAGWHGGAEWMNTSTLLFRYNLINVLLSGGVKRFAGLKLSDRLQGVATGDAAATLDGLAEEFLAAPLTTQQRETALAYVRTLHADSDREELLRCTVHLLTSTPQYQVC